MPVALKMLLQIASRNIGQLTDIESSSRYSPAPPRDLGAALIQDLHPHDRGSLIERQRPPCRIRPRWPLEPAAESSGRPARWNIGPVMAGSMEHQAG
jgi:hypothetical protein